MSCCLKSDDRSDLVLEQASGKLASATSVEFLLHTRSCPDCGALVRTQRAIAGALDAWQVAPVSPGFDKRLFARLEAAEATPWFGQFAASVSEWLRPVFARPALPLFAAAVVLIGGFVLDHPSKTINPVKAQSSGLISSSEVEQVEKTLDDLDMLHQFDATPLDKVKNNNSM